jgi:hypothetical protein
MSRSGKTWDKGRSRISVSFSLAQRIVVSSAKAIKFSKKKPFGTQSSLGLVYFYGPDGNIEGPTLRKRYGPVVR